jgi:hypothetical protein
MKHLALILTALTLITVLLLAPLAAEVARWKQ